MGLAVVKSEPCRFLVLPLYLPVALPPYIQGPSLSSKLLISCFVCVWLFLHQQGSSRGDKSSLVCILRISHHALPLSY